MTKPFSIWRVTVASVGISEQYQKEGWLCPGLFKYYKQAPKDIYVKAEKK